MLRRWNGSRGVDGNGCPDAMNEATVTTAMQPMFVGGWVNRDVEWEVASEFFAGAVGDIVEGEACTVPALAFGQVDMATADRARSRRCVANEGAGEVLRCQHRRCATPEELLRHAAQATRWASQLGGIRWGS
jgi:hypothetical protein